MVEDPSIVSHGCGPCRTITHMKVLKTFLLAALMAAVLVVLGALLLVRRGFRATTTPSTWELVVARTMRGLAIPRQAREQKNPLAASPDSLQQGRELFLAQCSACHGIDGGGMTPMGVNLYPRVPDLRTSSTQGLSDGEIHYIIENGVQLTGMPAWGNPHLESSGNSWKLVLFIRSLRPLGGEEQSREVATAGAARYS